MTGKTSLYIHIPYCKSKCRYCDFPSFSGKEETMDRYFSALIREISESKYKNLTIDTIFFGGGTPSIVDGKYIEKIMQTIDEKFILKDECEITLEANPATLTKEKLQIYKDSKINRISIGMQSHDDKLLRTLGRIHSAEDIVKSVEMINHAGFENYNLDVMFALPGQSVKDYEGTLRFAAALHPTHISAYSLIIEEGTPFYEMQERFELADEDEEREMYHLSKDILSLYGYDRYEVSNYAKKGFECRHNKFCWDYEDYIGFGSSAHSLIKPHRRENTPDIEKYISLINNTSSAAQITVLTKEDMISECIIMGLRKTEGVSLKFLKDNFGYDLETDKANEIAVLKAHGLVNTSNDYLYITTEGFDISDSITLKLI